MAFAHLVDTKDGRLTDLKELEIPEAPSLQTYASARGTVVWELKNECSRTHEFLAHHENKFDRFQTIFNVRSFLARMGIDAVVHDVTLHGETIRADVEFRFFLDTMRDGKLIYHVYDGLRANLSEKGIPVAQLVFLSADAKHLTPTQIGDGIVHQQLILPKGTDFKGEFVLFPLGDGQYQVGNFASLTPAAFEAVFADGKPTLTRLQPILPTASNNLRPRFDVRDIEVAADPDVRLLLDPKTNHPSVNHSMSLLLDLYPKLRRHTELQSPDSVSIPVTSVRIRGKFYPNSADTRETVTVPFAPQTSGPSSRSPRPATFDQLLTLEPAVLDFVRAVQEAVPAGVAGVVVGRTGTHVLPANSDTSLDVSAKYSARGRGPIDERPLNKLPQDLVAGLMRHPGARLIADYTNAVATHKMTHALITRSLPEPRVIEDLAASGQGIGTFFAAEVSGLEGRGALSLPGVAIDACATLVRDGKARIYWAPDGGAVRKMVGPTFAKMDSVGFYREMDLVIAVYLSHFDTPGITEMFDAQVDPFLNGLESLGLKIGLASGASSGLMARLNKKISGRPNIKAIGISTYFQDQTPDLSTDMFTLCGLGDRRDRQKLLTNVSDCRVALNGGYGSTGEVCEDGLDGKLGFLLPSPIGMVDLANIGNWELLYQHFQRITSVPNDTHPLGEKWTLAQYVPLTDLRVYFSDHLRPYLDNPVAWWDRNKVPPKVIRGGLEQQVKTTKYFGRKPSPIFEAARRMYGIS